jgi:hypothetical protein
VILACSAGTKDHRIHEIWDKRGKKIREGGGGWASRKKVIAHRA